MTNYSKGGESSSLPISIPTEPHRRKEAELVLFTGRHESDQRDNDNSQNSKVRSGFLGDAEGWRRRLISKVMESTSLQGWNKFFAATCLLAIFVDPLFSYVLVVHHEYKCESINWPLTYTVVSIRSLTDCIYLVHILIQSSLIYADLKPGKNRKEIAYLLCARKSLLLDLFNVFPVPQIISLKYLPRVSTASGTNVGMNVTRVAILIQYVPRLFLKFIPLLVGETPSGFLFAAPITNFIINLLMFVLAGHIVGACWYQFGFMRVNKCLRDACRQSYQNATTCRDFVWCHNDTNISWTNNKMATDCLNSEDKFNYGIYKPVVNLAKTNETLATRYLYSFFWGFQQISTLAGNQVPSQYFFEILFTMAIIVVALLLFATLIANMQNFLQTINIRRLEMSTKRHEANQWMKHRKLPKSLKRKVRRSVQNSWVVTEGINEEKLLNNIELNEDDMKKIKAHLFKIVRQVKIFKHMGEPFFNAIFEKLKRESHVKGSTILKQGTEIDKLLIISSGELEIVGGPDDKKKLTKGAVCGEELVVSDGRRKIKMSGRQVCHSNKTVKCLTYVEVLALEKSDLQEAIGLVAS